MPFDFAQGKPVLREFLVADADGALVIALTSRHVKAGAADADFNRVVVLVLMNILGRESKRILVSRFFGDVGIEAFEIQLLGTDECVAAGVVGKFQEFARALLNERFADRKRMADGNGIDGHVVGEQRVDGFVNGVGVVLGIASVGNEENHFAAFAAAGLQHVGCDEDGVVQSGVYGIAP